MSILMKNVMFDGKLKKKWHTNMLNNLRKPLDYHNMEHNTWTLVSIVPDHYLVPTPLKEPM